MTNLANRAEVLKLLADVAEIEHALTPAEADMFEQIKTKYEELANGSFDDKICLEVMIRNVAIREGYGMSVTEASGRKIDLPRK